MGAMESTPPSGYVMQEFAVGQRVQYQSDHGFKVPATITNKQFHAPRNVYIYSIEQDNGVRSRGAYPWQLTALGPAPATVVTTTVSHHAHPHHQPYPPQGYPPQQGYPYAPPQGYPPQPQGYPPQPQGYPPQPQGYPPQPQGYPPASYPPTSYPPPTQMHMQQNAYYPPQSSMGASAPPAGYPSEAPPAYSAPYGGGGKQ